MRNIVISLLHVDAITILANELPPVSPDDITLELLKVLGVPFVVLFALHLYLGWLAWKDAVRKASDSYAKASDFVRRKREDLPWQMSVLAAAQALFLAAVFSLSQLMPAVGQFGDSQVGLPTAVSEWLSVAFVTDPIRESTKAVVACALVAVAAVDFLMFTGRHRELDRILEGSMFLHLVATAGGVGWTLVAFFMSRSDNPVTRALSTGYFISGVLLVIGWVSLVATAFAAREFAKP